MNSCYGCTDRHIGCHSECEKYKAYCAERAELKAKINKNKEYTHYNSTTYATRINNVIKRRKKCAGHAKFGGGI